MAFPTGAGLDHMLHQQSRELARQASSRIGQYQGMEGLGGGLLGGLASQQAAVIWPNARHDIQEEKNCSIREELQCEIDSWLNN